MSTTRHQSASADADLGSPKVHVVTFGCQMNKYDSELVEGRFQKAGYGVTESMEDADVLLFNTCSVRDHAEERTWSWIGELKRAKEKRPELVIGLMGCMAQRVESEVFGRAGHVDLVAGTRQFHHLPRLVDEVREKRGQSGLASRDMRVLATDMTADVEVDRSGETYRGGTHAYLAVMRGCDLNCTYCIVPTTRGRVRSRPIEELASEAEWLVSQGVKVITLLGQTVNSYGEDFDKPGPAEPTYRGRQGRPSLADLLERLQGIDGLDRIRQITLHPSYVTRHYAEAIRDYDKVDRFLPLPAQAGADDVLKRMKRGYTLDLYRRRADLLREVVPDIELGSDWIVGFCGESEEHFAGSEAFLAEQQFLVNYIFKYDPRPGTRADDAPDDVPDAVKKERNQRLLAVAERTQRRRFEAMIGKTVPVYVESVSERDARVLLGKTTTGMSVSMPVASGESKLSPEERLNRLHSVVIDEASAFGMGGRFA